MNDRVGATSITTMDTTTESDTTSRGHFLTSLVTDQSLGATGSPSLTTPFAARTTSQKVVARLSQLVPRDMEQIATPLEETKGNMIGDALAGLSTMSKGYYDEVSPITKSQPVRSVTPTLSHPPTFSPWPKQASIKKCRSVSDSNLSDAGVQKRQRLLGLCDETKRLGGVTNPILPPLPYNTPFVDSFIVTEQQQALPKKEKALEFIYRGVHSLLDIQGYAQPFPDQAQTLIDGQQKKTPHISPHAYDESFGQSMINDGRGKIGQRGVSSTGVSARTLAAVLAQQGRAGEQEAELAIRRKGTGESMVSIGFIARGAAKEQCGDAGLAISPLTTAGDDSPSSFMMFEETKVMTSTERVLGSYELLERILLKCGEARDYHTVLKAQGVNRTFEKVVKRSMKLKRMLLSERKRRGRTLA